MSFLVASAVDEPLAPQHIHPILPLPLPSFIRTIRPHWSRHPQASTTGGSMTALPRSTPAGTHRSDDRHDCRHEFLDFAYASGSGKEGQGRR